MKQQGIWIDRRNARIIDIEGDKVEMQTVESEVEDYHVAGGSGTRAKGGPQDVVQDSRYLERERHQLARYFKEITPYMHHADKIVIFGPAQTAREFKQELEKKYSSLNAKVSSVEKADSMTDNQLKAWVRNYFG